MKCYQHKYNVTIGREIHFVFDFFSVANWPAALGEYKTKKDVKLALTKWSKYGRLYFQEGYDNNADIIVLFASGAHGD